MEMTQFLGCGTAGPELPLDMEPFKPLKEVPSFLCVSHLHHSKWHGKSNLTWQA